MNKQKVIMNIIGSESATLCLIGDLILGAFNVKVECVGETWVITAERDLPEYDQGEEVDISLDIPTKPTINYILRR